MISAIIGAKVFLINSSGQILALRRSETDDIRPLTWDIPGGGVEQDESPINTVIREVKEEVGLDISNPTIFYINSINTEGYRIRLLFYAKCDPEQITLSFEHDQYKWVSIDEFTKLELPDYQIEAANKLSKYINRPSSI